MSILILGGSGYIGTALCAALQQGANLGEVIVLSRTPAQVDSPHAVIRHYPDDLYASVRAADVVINLAGVSVVDTPWSKAGKLAILNSRVEPALATVHALQACARARESAEGPRCYIQASGISFYGSCDDPSETIVHDESSPSGDGFLAHVCRSWEAPAVSLMERQERMGVRTAILRIGMVLGPKAAAERSMIRLARWHLAGGMAHNDQWQSAISIRDLCRLIIWIIATPRAGGIYNAVAPEPIRLRELYPPLRATYGWQLPLAPPKWLLRTALGDKAQLFTDSLRIVPQRALDAGFVFDDSRPGLSLS